MAGGEERHYSDLGVFLYLQDLKLITSARSVMSFCYTSC